MRNIAPMFSTRSSEPTLETPLSSFTEQLSEVVGAARVQDSSTVPLRSSHSLTFAMITAVGMNSKKARVRSYVRTVLVIVGKLMAHILMKIKNCIRFMMFQRYFNPSARNIWSPMIAIEIPVRVDSTTEQTSLAASISP